MKETLKDVETRYETKLAIFMSTIPNDCSDKIEKKMKDSNSIHEKQSKTISQLESMFHRKLNEIEKTINCEQSNGTPKWADLEFVEKRCLDRMQIVSDSVEQLTYQQQQHNDNITRKNNRFNDNISKQSNKNKDNSINTSHNNDNKHNNDNRNNTYNRNI